MAIPIGILTKAGNALGSMSQFAGSGAGQQLIGGAELLAGLGTKIGSAANQHKSNRLALQAANQQAAAARENLADAGNPMANEAVQQVVNAAERNIKREADQQAQLASVTGATPEQQMAQYQMAQQALADVYSNVATNAGANYQAAKDAATAAAINPTVIKSQQYANKAAQLNTAAGNLLNSGMKSMIGGTK